MTTINLAVIVLAQALFAQLATVPQQDNEAAIREQAARIMGPQPAKQAVEAKIETPKVADEATTSEQVAIEAPKEEAKVEAETPAEEPKEVKVEKEEVPKAKKSQKLGDGNRSVRITSERTDYDRREGVIMFDRDVFVEDAEYKMHSDQLFVFLDGTNELKRIVAIGNVAITNETRVGTCAKAAYTKNLGKIVMYSDGNGVQARLADYGKRKSEVEGRKITFWIDSEQVEVEGSTVTLDAGGLGGKDGAMKLLR